MPREVHRLLHGDDSTSRVSDLPVSLQPNASVCTGGARLRSEQPVRRSLQSYSAPTQQQMIHLHSANHVSTKSKSCQGRGGRGFISVVESEPDAKTRLLICAFRLSSCRMGKASSRQSTIAGCVSQTNRHPRINAHGQRHPSFWERGPACLGGLSVQRLSFIRTSASFEPAEDVQGYLLTKSFEQLRRFFC